MGSGCVFSWCTDKTPQDKTPQDKTPQTKPPNNNYIRTKPPKIYLFSFIFGCCFVVFNAALCEHSHRLDVVVVIAFTVYIYIAPVAEFSSPFIVNNNNNNNNTYL